MMPSTDTGSVDEFGKANEVVRKRRLIRIAPSVAGAVLLLVLIVGIAAPLLTPYSPVDNNLIESNQPPMWIDGGSSEHPLGTDGFGRDVLSRLMYGARVSLVVVVSTISIAVAIGVLLGVVAGYVGGAVDSVIMRIVDLMLAVPPLLVALVVAVALGPSLRNLILIMGLLIWPNIARLIRGETMALRSHRFVVYAKAIGLPRRRILMRHVLPNILPTLLVAATLEVANVILTEASLSFLGAGLPPPTPSWGVMIADGRALLATGWWISLFPGLAITATVLSFNAIGDWLRDYLDPRTRLR